MNKQRILELIRIMRNKTDAEHKLTIRELMSELDQKAIKVSDRKTLYDDFHDLEEYGLIVENDNGRYYLQDAPFSLAEIKILTDSLNSLKDLDDRFVSELKDKLYAYISQYEMADLQKLEYQTRHANKHLIHRLEDTLEAIREQKTILIQRKGKDKEEI
ncbi:MAG: hypothetical protein IKS69_02620, partial [Erysipelotrichaceae bacterium]|nr:hypothetical protein [Erysipelotrichaceae bacterium]